MSYTKNIYNKINKCRVSYDKNLIMVAKFPPMGLTGTFPKTIKEKIIKTPFEVVFSKKSKLLQLRHNYNPNILYGKNYGYRSGLNPTMINHLESKQKKLLKKFKIQNKDLILDIGSNDGTFLNFFNNNKRCYAVDPSIIKLKKYYKKKINLYPLTFENAFNKISNKKFKLVTAIAMFYDLENPIKFVKNIKSILNKDGIFHIEVAYLPEIIKTFSYDTFCQEHYEYYSLLSLNYIFNKCDMKILNFGKNDINGGSIWINVSHKNTNLKIEKNKIEKQINYEIKNNIHKVSTYKNFFKDVFNHAKKIKQIITNKKNKNLKISGFGASTKGNVLLQLANIDNNKLDRIYDVNNEKFGKFTPITKIPIVNETKLKNFHQDYVLILIWHFKKFVINKIKKANKKIKLIIPFPKIKII
jgi:SAM-dependent methyltransferase